jgi:prepilin-type N-terminal cleavage/methylation domain-containing protein
LRERIARLRRENGYTLTEMLIVMSIMTIVMTGITSLFVQASNAEIDLNGRFQAQQAARLALDKIRRETHCASAVVVNVSNTQATLTFPTGSTCGTQVSWCTALISTSRYGLYRTASATCNSSGTKWADYLTAGNGFTYQAPSFESLAKLGVDLPVNTKPSKAYLAYRLTDSIALRNSTRF